ncbi:MAG TPA: polysaccharide deacetylase family protein [Dehalococcoidia bacterium]|nr:polysaccharide deacetylase family protein [Dehalococcoidia bacterium]
MYDPEKRSQQKGMSRRHFLALAAAGTAGLAAASVLALNRESTQPTGSPVDAALLRPEDLEPAVFMRVVDLQNDPIAVSNRFLAALSGKQYADLWSMLAPAEQAAWSGPEQFSGFLQAKFGKRTLGYALGRPEKRSGWFNPDTRQITPNVQIVPVTLTVDGINLQIYPLAFVDGGGSLQVLTPGPAARQGPVLRPEAVSKAVRVPILMYHHVADSPSNSLTVPLKQFNEELSYLRQRGYNSVTMTDVMNAIYYGLPTADRPIILSFDDGYGDAYSNALPVLQKYGFTGTFALITNAIDHTKEGYLSVAQVQEMSGAGMEFVSHTHNHTDLAKVTDDQVIGELRASKDVLNSILGWPAQHLIYPYGSPFARGTAADQARIKKLLPQEGYAAAATTIAGSTQDPAAPYELHRIAVSGGEVLSRFTAPLPY